MHTIIHIPHAAGSSSSSSLHNLPLKSDFLMLVVFKYSGIQEKVGEPFVDEFLVGGRIITILVSLLIVVLERRRRKRRRRGRREGGDEERRTMRGKEEGNSMKRRNRREIV